MTRHPGHEQGTDSLPKQVGDRRVPKQMGIYPATDAGPGRRVPDHVLDRAAVGRLIPPVLDPMQTDEHAIAGVVRRTPVLHETLEAAMDPGCKRDHPLTRLTP